MNKNKKRIILGFLIPILIIGIIAGITIGSILGTINMQSNNQPVLKDPTEENVPNFNNPTKNQIENVSSGSFSKIGVFYEDIVNQEKRNVNKQYYNSEVYAKYHQDYNFVYPGYNHNYEIGNNKYFINSSGQRINGQNLVYNEKVTDNNGNYLDENGNITTDPHKYITYNNDKWIINEIKNNRLKKHLAADTFYEYKFGDDLLSTTKKYIISTSVLGPVMLGLYAPAGEVITLTFDDDTFNLLKQNNYRGLKIVINQNYWDNRENENDSGAISNRYPFVRTTFEVDPNQKQIKFGTPFGGGISIEINSQLLTSKTPFFPTVENISFTVSGAIECMLYTYGSTTEDNFNQQLKKLKANQMGPVVQANDPYFAFTIPLTSATQVGHLEFNDITYPKVLFDKWNDFLFLSNYFKGTDLSPNARKLNMQFCDDIWGGAGAWGGGMNFYCPTRWGSNSFLSNQPSTLIFNSKESWGLFHEINHNFQQDKAFFRRTSHPKTNEVNIFNLSVINDTGRYRSEYNYSGTQQQHFNEDYDWTRLDNPFINIYNINKWNETDTNDEYPIQELLLALFGSKNYVDYVRWDRLYYPNDDPNWTGLIEIDEISHILKLNLWPAFEIYGKYWRDQWPISYNVASTQEKKIIDNLKIFPAIDFIGNIYACGSYLYNYETSNYIYTGDILPPFEIVANEDYCFKIDQFTNSINQNFNIKEIKFSPVSKNGGHLRLDPNHPLNLIYSPPSTNIDQIDEFDLDIIPGDWVNKPDYYVPSYRFKIKVRQVINEPKLEFFNHLSQNIKNEELLKQIKNYKNPNYIQPLGFWKTPFFDRKDQKQAARVTFNFIVPKDGQYLIKNKWDDLFALYIDNQQVFTANSYTNNFQKTYESNWKKGQVIKFELDVLNTGGIGGLETQIFLNNKQLNLFDYVLIPDYQLINSLNNVNPLDILNNKIYQYQSRQIDYEVYNKSITSNLNFSNYDFEVYDPKEYKLTSKYKYVDYLNDYSTNYFELWNTDYVDPINNQKYPYMEFDVSFKKPQIVRSFLFGNRTNNHWSSRPTNVKIYGVDVNEKKYLVYDGLYGSQFDDRNNEYTVINVDDIYNEQNELVQFKELKFEMYNTDNPSYGGIILQWFRISSNLFYPSSNSFSFDNFNIKMTQGWRFLTNDPLQNLSAYNNKYLISNKKDDVIEFTLNNANGFALIGQLNHKSNSSVQVFVNDVLIDIVNNNASKRYDNAVLFKLKPQFNKQQIKVKIVHIDDQPFILNYIMTFGDDTYLS